MVGSVCLYVGLVSHFIFRIYALIFLSTGLSIFIAFFILLKMLESHLPPGAAHMPLLGTWPTLVLIHHIHHIHHMHHIVFAAVVAPHLLSCETPRLTGTFSPDHTDIPLKFPFCSWHHLPRSPVIYLKVHDLCTVLLFSFEL